LPKVAAASPLPMPNAARPMLALPATWRAWLVSLSVKAIA
jgi:hypothetical protein